MNDAHAPKNAIADTVGVEQLAALSHEFRTPLNGVLGMARLLEGTGLTDEQRTYVTALRDSGEHLLGLVNDLLDFAKLGVTQVELQKAEVDLDGLLGGVCELLSPRAHEKGLEIAWFTPPDVARIIADEGRLRQILLNFAANAIKFTRSGGVFLNVRRVGSGRLRFEVSDTGPGVPSCDQLRIFEAFAQSDPSRDGEKLGGAGLGLAIARTLAGVMEGEVGVENGPEGGARFWFEAMFPCIPRARARPLRGRTIGIMTANSVLSEAACRQIEASGARANSNLDAQSVIPEGEVLLVDHALKPAEPPDDRAALILLAPEARGEIDHYRRLGFAGYLIKPLRPGSLAERVLAALGKQNQRAREDERVAIATAPGTRVLLVEDNAINALLARTLLVREGCIVDHAIGGEEALAATSVGSYDLILMDMRMPGQSGLEVTSILRARGLTTPIVALTANAFEDDRQACLAGGMDDFLVKPISMEALRRVLSQLMHGGWTSKAERANLG